VDSTRNLPVLTKKADMPETARLHHRTDKIWTAAAGSTLRESIFHWAKQAGWVVNWLAEDLDYPIIGNLTYSGSFENAVIWIFGAYEKAERPMFVDGNVMQRMLVVTEKK